MKLRHITETVAMTNCNICSTGIVSTKCPKCGKSVCQNCMTDELLCSNCADTAYNAQSRLRESKGDITESVEDYKRDRWFQLLKPKEQEMIERLLSDKAAEIAPDRHAAARSFIETMATLEELMPFKGNDRLNFMSWWDDARKAGLLTHNDKSALCRFCIDNLYF